MTAAPAPDGDLRLPAHAPGLRVGLLGGSFNPPHEAHRAVSLYVLKRLGLDRVWWLVTPGNPLKDTRHLPPLANRIAAAKKIAAHPRIAVTGIEAVIGTSYTYATIAWLKRHCRGVHFVWIMGVDNFEYFHRWKHWDAIVTAVPIAVVDRGHVGLDAFAAPAARKIAPFRVRPGQERTLATMRPPAWAFLSGLKSSTSSTELRKSAGGGG